MLDQGSSTWATLTLDLNNALLWSRAIPCIVKCPAASLVSKYQYHLHPPPTPLDMATYSQGIESSHYIECHWMRQSSRALVTLVLDARLMYFAPYCLLLHSTREAE
jgi:hypothetical protein